MNSRFNKKAHETNLDPMLFFKLILKTLAHLHHGRHIDLIESGQYGIGRLRLQKTLSHTGSESAHGHTLLGSITQINLGCTHLRQGSAHGARDLNGRSRFGCLGRLKGISLGDTAVLACACNGG